MKKQDLFINLQQQGFFFIFFLDQTDDISLSSTDRVLLVGGGLQVCLKGESPQSRSFRVSLKTGSRTALEQ